MRSAVLAALVLLAGCKAANDTRCTGGNTCTCPADSVCQFDMVGCGPTSCTFECGARSVCSGRCGESCSVTCEAGANCDIGVGTSGSVSCGTGGDCHVTCPNTCSVSCASGASCTIRCASDAVPRTFTGSASCP